MSEYDAQIAQVANTFNAISDSYDGSGVDFFQPIADGLVQALGTFKNEEWLDIGCGRGAIAQQSAKHIKSLVGIDISNRMIENAESMAIQKNLTNVEFLLDDAQDPSQITDKFDVISSSLVLFFLPNPLEALIKWRSFLKDSGRIGVTTFGSNDQRWEAVDSLFRKYTPPQTLDARTSGARSWFGSDVEMERLLKEAGYSSVRTVRQGLPVRFASPDQWHDFSWSTGQRAMWLRVPESERPKVRSEAYSLLETFADMDGSITFSQGIRHTLAMR